MKIMGWLLLAIGVVTLLFGCAMDTSVASSLGSGRVHNLGLMRQQENIVIVGCLFALLGVLLVLFSKKTTIDSASGLNINNSVRLKSCPYCAEQIRTEAIICRFCERDIGTQTRSIQNLSEVFSEAESEAMQAYGIKFDGGKYFVGIYEYNSLDEAVANAQRGRLLSKVTK